MKFWRTIIWRILLGGVSFAGAYFSGDTIQRFLYYELDVSDGVSGPIALIIGALIGGCLIEATYFARNWLSAVTIMIREKELTK